MIGHGNGQFAFFFHSIINQHPNKIPVQDILANTPDNHRAMFVPMILGSDKTTVLVATGLNEYWPLYGSVGNLHNSTQCGHGQGLVLIGFLAIPKGTISLFLYLALRVMLDPFSQLIGLNPQIPHFEDFIGNCSI